jgi:hypothetical protein
MNACTIRPHSDNFIASLTPISAGDPSSPLKEILVLITPYNLWANIQADTRPASMLFDVLNVDHWRPFFGVKLPPPLGGLQSIQVQRVVYRAAQCCTLKHIQAMQMRP